LMPTLFEFALLAAIGVAATLGQWMALRAYRAAEASAVVPFDYLRLVFAIAFGWAIFAEIPDRWTLAGSGVLIAATAFIAWREIKAGRNPSVGGG
jgi:drug/metabolite transporter (DMT)-like permease